MNPEARSVDERMRNVSERIDLALNSEHDDSFMEFKPSDINLFIEALSTERSRADEIGRRIEATNAEFVALAKRRQSAESMVGILVVALEATIQVLKSRGVDCKVPEKALEEHKKWKEINESKKDVN